MVKMISHFLLEDYKTPNLRLLDLFLDKNQSQDDLSMQQENVLSHVLFKFRFLQCV